MLSATDQPLVAGHDLLVLDLDGVVYRGPRAVPGAPRALDRARQAGVALAFVTNNAARTPQDVAAHLRRLGVQAQPGDVVTSAQAAVRLLGQRVPAGSAIYVIGGEGLLEALREKGMEPITDVAMLPSSGAAAVVQGYGPDMLWRQVVDGAILVRDGALWVASNTDMTIPTDRGIGPGNGTLVQLVAQYAGRQPEVAGKPEPALFEETLERVGGSRPLMVGDRLDTDIGGAVRLGWDTLLVLTGVTGLPELVRAPAAQRPAYLGSTLASLHAVHRAPTTDGTSAQLEGWRATVHQDRLVISGTGSVDDWWRVVACAAWQHLDATGRPVDVSTTTPPDEARAEQEDADDRPA